MQISKTITFQATIQAPEGYEDVHPELIILDFVENPQGFVFAWQNPTEVSSADSSKGDK